MTDSHSITDPFFRHLHRTLSEDVDNRMVSLAKGSAGNYADYRYQIGIIEGLSIALEKGREVDHEHYGPRPGANNEQD